MQFSRIVQTMQIILYLQKYTPNMTGCMQFKDENAGVLKMILKENCKKIFAL